MGERSSARLPWAIGWLLALELAAFCVTTIPGVRSGPGFLAWADGWLQAFIYLTAAALAALRPMLSNEDRKLWSAVAAALGARAVGFVVQLAWVRAQHPPPFPSVADAAWLLTYPLLLVGLVSLAGTTMRRLTVSLALDGTIGALALGAVAYAVLAATLTELSRPADNAAVFVNLAYPLLDVLVLLVVFGVLLTYRVNPPASVWVLMAGVAGFAVVDATYVFQITSGTFVPGGALQALSAVATGLIAVAGHIPGKVSGRSGRAPLPHLLLPTTFALIALAVISWEQLAPLPTLSVALAVAALLIAILRTHLSYRLVQSAAIHHRRPTDELTHLANRRAFNETVSRVLHLRADHQSLALLIVDLDDFKQVNDTLGHHRGDELLIQVADRLQHSLRSGDLLARIGGDEFAVLIDGATEALAADVADRLRAGINTPYRVGSHDVRTTASVGIALFPDHGRDPDELFQSADIAMYNAKLTRVGQSLFTRELYRSNRARLEAVARLHTAITDHEMTSFQPLIRLGPDTPLGVEVLVRWVRPDGTVVPPGDFLTQVENAGLMTQLTEEVLDQSLRAIAGWRVAGPIATVAVNVSVSTLLDAGFPGRVADLLIRHGVPGDVLEIEITEDLLMADPAQARTVIDALCALDVGIVVDDYGTGYSSLGYLRDLTGIRGLKLDRSFVRGVEQDVRAQAIVSSTLTLARALDLNVVAEGVETRAERDTLIDLGCELAQGYHFGRPMPAEMISSLYGPSTVAAAEVPDLLH